MYNPLIRCAAAAVFIAAFIIVAFSAFKTAKTIRKSIGEMVRNDADIKKAGSIVKRFIWGKGEKGDGGELVRAVFGIRRDAEGLSGRVVPDLFRL